MCDDHGEGIVFIVMINDDQNDLQDKEDVETAVVAASGRIGVANEPDQSNPSRGGHKISWANLLQNILDHRLSDCSAQKKL